MVVELSGSRVIDCRQESLEDHNAAMSLASVHDREKALRIDANGWFIPRI